MKVIINFTENKPEETIIVDAVSNDSLKGIAIKTVDLHLLYRIYGLNILKVGKERFYYRPFTNPDKRADSNTWYEVKKMPKSLLEIVNNFYIISPVRIDFINKLLKNRRDEYTRKTD